MVAIPAWKDSLAHNSVVFLRSWLKRRLILLTKTLAALFSFVKNVCFTWIASNRVHVINAAFFNRLSVLHPAPTFERFSRHMGLIYWTSSLVTMGSWPCIIISFWIFAFLRPLLTVRLAPTSLKTTCTNCVAFISACGLPFVFAVLVLQLKSRQTLSCLSENADWYPTRPSSHPESQLHCSLKCSVSCWAEMV